MSFAPPLSERVQARVALPFALCTLIWGSTWFVIGSQLHYAPAGWSITWRFVLAALAMTLVARATGASLRLDARQHGVAALVGLTQFTLNYLFVYAAEAHIASGLVALVSALMILPNALFARVFLGQSVSRRFLGGSVLAVGGIAVLFADELVHAAMPPGRVLTGVGLAIAGLLAASTANVLQGTRAAGRVPPVSLLAWAMAYGSTVDAAVALVTDGTPRLPTATTYLAGLVYLAVAGSAVAFTCYLRVIRTVGPARAAYVAVLIPVLAMAISTMLEDYRWTGPGAFGATLTVAGLIVAMRARSPAR